MNDDIIIEINTILSIYFCQEEISPRDITLLELFYPKLSKSKCDILQAVYFILEYRRVTVSCNSYEKVILDKLVVENKCTLDILPPFQQQSHLFIGSV